MYDRVTAVSVGVHLYPWAIASQDLRLCLNPRSARAELGALLSMDRAEANGDCVEWHGGVSAREVLGLAQGWPGQLHPNG
jgi:hypothetical protein